MRVGSSTAIALLLGKLIQELSSSNEHVSKVLWQAVPKNNWGLQQTHSTCLKFTPPLLLRCEEPPFSQQLEFKFWFWFSIFGRNIHILTYRNLSRKKKLKLMNNCISWAPHKAPSKQGLPKVSGLAEPTLSPFWAAGCSFPWFVNPRKGLLKSNDPGKTCN